MEHQSGFGRLVAMVAVAHALVEPGAVTVPVAWEISACILYKLNCIGVHVVALNKDVLQNNPS